MSSSLESLAFDYSSYQKIFEIYLRRSTEHLCMRDFIHGILRDILKGIGEDKTAFNVIGVGCGSGEVDLELLPELQRIFPDVNIDYSVVEPSGPMLNRFKALLSEAPNLENVNFTWNQMTTCEFEKQWRERQPEKKMDFIHMFQMLYYVPDPGATVSFFRTLLNENGKLIATLVSGECGWGKLWKTFVKELSFTNLAQSLNAADLKSYLTAKGITFEIISLPTTLDITGCFDPNDEEGGLVLDLITEMKDFRNRASPDLKTRILDFLRHPDHSTEVDGRFLFDTGLEVLILGS